MKSDRCQIVKRENINKNLIFVLVQNLALYCMQGSTIISDSQFFLTRERVKREIMKPNMFRNHSEDEDQSKGSCSDLERIT